MTARPRLLFPVLATAGCVVLAVAAAAQGPKPAAPGIMQGFTQSQTSDQPVQIEAAALEVREKAKMATFSGNVQVVQGDTVMKCQTLVVFYDTDRKAKGRSASAIQAPPGGIPTSAQSIRRIEARGGVTVTTRDQNASGDLGVFDMESNTITLSGNVTVSQGQNVMHGDRVVVNMTTGVSRLESGAATNGRVRALIQPKGEGGGASKFMLPAPPRAE